MDASCSSTPQWNVDRPSFTGNFLREVKKPPGFFESKGNSVNFSSESEKPIGRYNASVQEASLVRLAMNALQGLESSLTSIEKLCTIFRSDPTDRTFHRIPNLWNKSLSTLALEKILRSLGCMGCEVFFLRKFINHFTNLNWDDANKRADSEASNYPPYSLVNQAFAVAVADVLEGYIAALDTLYSSVGLRRLTDNGNISTSNSILGTGFFSSVGHSEVTLLEVYLHTKELRTQIEVIGNICNVHNIASGFSLSSLEDLDTRTKFSDFPRGGNLLTYLYMELKVADPVHCALLKTLFVRSCEPYFDFIRSWIFKAKITDPFSEFIVAECGSEQIHSLCNTGVLIDFPSAIIREQDEVYVPCFLREFMIPLFRAGQQLQVLIKLLEFSDGAGSWNRTYEEFLPYWSRMSSSRLSHAFHMDFSKEEIEKMVLARRDYYRMMMEKLKSHLPNLEFKYHQVIPYSALSTSGRRSLECSSAADGRPLSPSAKNINQNLPLGTVECDASSMTDEFSYTEDLSDSSECSSTGNEEEADASEKTIEVYHDSEDLEKKYLSALEFSSDTSFNILLKKHSQGESPFTMGNEAHALSENEDLPHYSLHPQHSEMNMNNVPLEIDQNLSCMMEAQDPNDHLDSEWPLNPIAKNSICNDSWTIKNMSGFECSNLILGTNKLRERCSKVYLPSFDFKSVRDPFTECVDRLSISDRGGQFLVSAKSAATTSNYHNKAHVRDTITVEKNSSHTQAPLCLKNDHQEQAFIPNVSGGGCREILLDGTNKKNDNCHGGRKTSVASVIEIPLDFVLEKCLLEEIQLQYLYVSKLTIKLLEEGFSLKEHLLALRRYHMMESADWADLFIVSLCHRKWYATEADKRISEIQGLLELSVQRSSCERDRYKDRLFVYIKEQGSSALPGFAAGIQSFNVLGLGYRVDWPVSIVLTPGALKMYAQIFSFLMQVKLAQSSLTEVWCSFKEVNYFTNQDHHSDLRKSESRHFNIMVKLRHQIFHFVATLQQYVQSQLSHVSWCRFLQSLKHKVKDLTDLDFVHMDYLNDSQCICFLSNDMKQVAEIIQSILQCALDFRSVVMPNMTPAGKDGGGLLNIAQVLAIKETFYQNMRQLYACYLNSPKNVEFGVPRFWEYLDYNHHYSDVFNEEIGPHIFSFYT